MRWRPLIWPSTRRSRFCSACFSVMYPRVLCVIAVSQTVRISAFVAIRQRPRARSTGVGGVPLVETLVHAGVVVGAEANGLGTYADVLAEIARGYRRRPRAYREHQRGTCHDTCAGCQPGDLFGHCYRLRISV